MVPLGGQIAAEDTFAAENVRRASQWPGSLLRFVLGRDVAAGRADRGRGHVRGREPVQVPSARSFAASGRTLPSTSDRAIAAHTSMSWTFLCSSSLSDTYHLVRRDAARRAGISPSAWSRAHAIGSARSAAARYLPDRRTAGSTTPGRGCRSGSRRRRGRGLDAKRQPPLGRRATRRRDRRDGAGASSPAPEGGRAPPADRPRRPAGRSSPRHPCDQPAADLARHRSGRRPRHRRPRRGALPRDEVLPARHAEPCDHPPQRSWACRPRSPSTPARRLVPRRQAA